MCWPQPFWWTDKEVYTKPELSDLTAFCHWLQPFGFTRRFDSSQTTGGVRVGTWASRLVRMCVSLYVWGPVGKYLFMLFFVQLLPPFIALQRHRLSVCVLGGFALYLCVWSVWLTGLKGFYFLFFLRGWCCLLEHTIHKKVSSVQPLSPAPLSPSRSHPLCWSL